MRSETAPYIILFDGVCNLCNRTVQFILKHDKEKKFLFASLQGKAGQEFLYRHRLPQDHFNSFILIEKNGAPEAGKIFTRSAGGLRMLKHLGGGWSLFYGLIVIPSFLRDPVYDLIARNRYKWFGKQESCWVPTPELRSRFLD
jgi:predicted DCC family thiol-disulfide oxidoreductase YuxK